MKKINRPEPCLRCGSKDIFWDDCGYSSFNCGTAKCGNCGFKLELSNLSCFPEKEIRRCWNSQSQDAVEKLKELQGEVKKLEKLLGRKKSNVKRR